ncbi:mas-related G-protein coupled receptor member H [Microtus ochrogaster]|uniref:Mas-related G-protein coupled receptor member H n=1 Tax=Microtus ochrogaster TaxID=79684 RepID=A0A8J6GT83_MICOH|nr:mas-related G-protein coupled receptor member H [Microtus ochrogaster]XP_026643136.1 mas-related G-protein coupled receptor member H [Microtus ochrogaster]KAH0519986.1 Mas-related G-protein coupled receptor member H [Microtus ochrogaster]
MEPLATTFCPLEHTQYTGNESLNETTWSSKQVVDYSYISVSLVICMLGLTGNGLLIWFLVFCVKRKPFTIYLLHLAIADFMVLLCSSVIQLVNTFHIHDVTLLSYAIFLMIFGYNTGLHLLTAISVERCLSVLYPIWYQCRRPKHQSAVACALLWALSVLVSGLENFFCILEVKPRFPECRYVYIFSCILTFLVFVPLMVFSNLILFVQVCCNLKPRQPAKLYVIIMATVILFLVFAMPMKVLLIVGYYSNSTDESVWKSLPYLTMLSTINCSINPVVYVVVGSLSRKRRQKSLKEALQKVFEEKTAVGSREDVTQFPPLS